MADAPFRLVFCGCFDRFMITYGVFPVNPTKLHNKTRAKSTKTGSVFWWSTSVLAKSVARKKTGNEAPDGASFGMFGKLEFTEIFRFSS